MTAAVTSPAASRSALAPAEQALRMAIGIRTFSQYDALRLSTYQRAERLGQRIQFGSLGNATLLRFDDVGYFNRIYAPDESIVKHLEAVEAFYRGGPFGCELVGPPGGDSKQLDEACRQRGWTHARSYAWLYARAASLVRQSRGRDGFVIRPPAESERTTFLHCYLRAFEAEPERIPAAVKNMRHLFDRPELHFLLAWKGDQPAGIGMLYWDGGTAALCAGATLPDFRRNGCHHALLAARIRTAIDHGCEHLCTWAALGSQSQMNMESSGLTTVAVSPSWRFGPATGPSR